MKSVLRQLFTGADGQTHDIGRYLWALGVLTMIIYAGWHVIQNHQFDPVAYGTGLGALLAGGGAGVALKYRAEPPHSP